MGQMHFLGVGGGFDPELGCSAAVYQPDESGGNLLILLYRRHPPYP
ncbi:hypothetical protein [Neiella marina]|nr:hypothetical protein [Neiella marina]